MRKNSVQIENKKVYKSINMFLINKKLKSENTERSYRKNIKEFFEFLRSKQLEELEPSDLHLSLEEVMEYQQWLTESLSSASVNQRISTLKSLYKFLSSEYDVNRNVFNNIDNLEMDSKSYGKLYWEEIEEMMRRVKNTRKGSEKALLIEMAVKTSFRLSLLLDLQWSDFHKENGMYLIRIKDKGTIREGAIRKEDYKRLESALKGQYGNSVFGISKNTINRMIQWLVEEMKIPKYRNIKFHSLKKSGFEEVYQATDDYFKSIRQHGNYKTVATNIKYYNEMEQDPDKRTCLMIGKKIDVSPLHDLSKEEMIELIEDLDRVTQLRIMKMFYVWYGSKKNGMNKIVRENEEDSTADDKGSIEQRAERSETFKKKKWSIIKKHF